jgi:hypothetical protein
MGEVPSLSALFKFEPVIVTSANPDDWAKDNWLKPVVMRSMTARLILDGLNILRTFVT